MENLFNRFHSNKYITEKSIAELRCGIPVLLYNSNDSLLIFPSELIDNQLLNTLKKHFKDINILVTGNRLNFIFQSSGNQLSRIKIKESHDLEYISSLLTGQELHKGSLVIDNVTVSTNSLDITAISLIKLTKLLPSAVVVDINDSDVLHWCTKNNITPIRQEIIENYNKEYEIQEVCSSPLFLKDCSNAKINVYRSHTGELEHYAIIIENPDYSNPIIRIHSSCYTGDLLNSLSCDCRCQLHTAIKLMIENKGGIILYLAQDGRGIGLANKIRTYQLQIKHNFDTVDANRFFGFEDDERVFIPAIKILQKLGISRLQLLTNNPNKISEIQNHGIQVTKILPIFVDTNQHNINYINTKAKRLGHVC
ncbi:GTP cyclohydrolase II family protein [Ehrlichia chaffeensis str. Heartland]|uniref:GTP cyclohydrolase II n=2 Tax=Ehrlichia chaffeensis TaxID=945 RepID=Q2GI56_EHRCR|nr:GTP cyclohydrolase II [Ehrlichia chaffeensis]ABD44653.1 putative GTP cyclohydrolase II [Ehrlichia chaffeensis str. Arkansas]AHX04136.1 GTP cyclohydrolase II family protein [Ehrlichia chaffeensis str. Heartland]AHX06071.1 GTP cyclohydrolase II family protein [Ehrlichia chaffeensis str. Jax]AHX07060.1 GTP cyclohydrolase II family protein [Ehrlichia chaffeensis str. Liberty]AHX07108.1 GTP cyclohydrolase II family protein [Ehrlichia chaffeensis str. Osceola]